jgi:hypothetical protein
MKTGSESGIALIAALLIMVLLSALLVGFIVSINSDQGLIGVDRDQNRAFYGSLAGLEQLTADLGTLFNNNYAPTVTQINALTTRLPAIPGISYVSPGGDSGYQIQFLLDAQGKPRADTRTIPSGPYEGLVGLLTQYTMTSTAHTVPGSEVRMRRTLQTVAVPVFQFGIFSETDLSFHAGPNFNFGGRVHTNGNLFLSEGDGSTLTMSNRVTAVGEVVRKYLVNGWPTSSNYNGQVSITTAPGSYRALAFGEGSVTGTLGSGQNEPTWTNLSIGTYNGNIRNGRTGARRMDLPLASFGGGPIDLIRRPPVGENATNPEVFQQRYFGMASLRVLLSDTAADLTSLPTVTSTDPIHLIGVAPDGRPIAASSGISAQGYRSPDGTITIGGYIKIDMQDQAGGWQDVTQEILQLGIAGRDLTGTCVDPPNSIIRVQRLKDTPAACSGASANKYQYWPNVLYDTREGALRDNIPTTQTTVYLGGVMNYIELDVNNLARWFRGTIGTSGGNAMNTTGYVVYFSDRRTNRNAANQETGEYGFEDFVNPGSVNGTPNGVLDTAEDVNGDSTLEVYGQTPVSPIWFPLDSTARPWTAISSDVARRNQPVFFRRALKLVNGQTIDLGIVDGVPLGLAVASENPIYVQGNYNAAGTFAGTHAASSLIADAVTFLSNAWSDSKSFAYPHSLAGGGSGRTASTTWYRIALISGKGMPFPQPASTPQDFGTDGGVHNFLRLLENWSGQTLNYRGSMVSLYINRQAVGLYKCCNNVYSPPTRGYNFDVEFLQPSLLPPRTPMFRDVNITGFTRLIMPNQ